MRTSTTRAQAKMISSRCSPHGRIATPLGKVDALARREGWTSRTELWSADETVSQSVYVVVVTGHHAGVVHIEQNRIFRAGKRDIQVARAAGGKALSIAIGGTKLTNDDAVIVDPPSGVVQRSRIADV